MNWRVIALETHDAYFNMAADEAIGDAVRDGKSLPTIRLYKWLPSAVSIGCFQSMRDEVNIERCNELRIDYVRRRTGGGAVYHDANGEITYSIIGPQSYFPSGIRESYRFICNWIIEGLSAIGIKAEFIPINDIVVDGKKISGNAQTRREGILLQHGTILYRLSLQRMFEVLRVSSEKISDKMIKSAEERVTCVCNHVNVTENELYNSLLAAFTKGKDYEMNKMSDEELSLASELANSTYKTRAWSFSR